MPYLRFLTCAFILLVLAVPGRASEDLRAKAQVTANVSGGFARVQFDWSEDVKGSAQITGGVLVVTFEKPFEADTAQLSRVLEPYAALVRRDADGKVLRVALKGEVRLKTTNHGSRYAFDLIPASFKGEPPAVPVPANVKSQGDMFVRVTEREKTTRLQFDFPGRVDHSFRITGDKLIVSFSKLARVDLRRFSTSPPTWIRGARSFSEGDKLTLEFDIDREADFRDVSDKGEIAVVLMEPKSDATAITERGDAAGPPKVLIGADDANVPPPPKVVADEIELERPSRKTATAAGGTGADGRKGRSDIDALQVAAASLADAEIKRAGEPPAPTLATADPLPAALRVGQTDLAAALSPNGSSPQLVPGQADVQIFGSMVRIELPYAKLPAAAIFRRGLAVWVVTDTPAPMDLSALSELPNAPVRLLSAVTEVAAGITAFRLAAPASMSVSASALGNSWIIVIGNTVPELPERLQLIRQKAGTNITLKAPMPGLTQVVWLQDPDAKDRIAVVMGHAPARGLLDPRRFVEFAALPSRQGLAIQAIADDLSVAIEGQEAVISRPGGLNVSPTQLVTVTKVAAPVASNGGSLAAVDFAQWARPVAATHADTVSELILEASRSDGGMNAPRLALARYYVANEYGAEALGVLRAIAHDDRTAATDITFRIMRALANINMARYKEALADLDIESIGGDPHAALWRGIAATGARDWRLARNNLVVALKVISRYPNEWQARGRVALAMSALALGDSAAAKLALEGMPKSGLSPRIQADVALSRALTDAALDRRDPAIEQFERLVNSRFRPVAARAALELTLLKHKTGKLTNRQAIDNLERLRFQWRGDEVELKTLQELALLYVAENDVRLGLDTMRLAVRHFSETDEARQSATRMSEMFQSFFLGEKSQKLTPLQALSLFYDYKDLTPVGAQGDEMIRRLVERLITVDLLPQAAELLQHQVNNRLEGIPRAAVAARLAVIYLMDKQPSKALETIRDTRQARLPDDLILQRDMIESRALADTKDFDQALEVLSSNTSEEAEQLRADIYWDAQRWVDAAKKAEEIVGTRYAGEESLSDGDRLNLMRASVAYSLAGDAAALERLRSRFSAKMSNSPDAKAFVMLTTAPDVASEDYRNLVKRVASVDTLSAFLADFREKLSAPVPSATN